MTTVDQPGTVEVEQDSQPVKMHEFLKSIGERPTRVEFSVAIGKMGEMITNLAMKSAALTDRVKALEHELAILKGTDSKSEQRSIQFELLEDMPEDMESLLVCLNESAEHGISVASMSKNGVLEPIKETLDYGFIAPIKNELIAHNTPVGSWRYAVFYGERKVEGNDGE